LEPKHGGCYDCGSKEDEHLKSVTCYRQGKIVNAALCERCFRKEMINQKAEGRL
jgi:hypothetical protein